MDTGALLNDMKQPIIEGNKAKAESLAEEATQATKHLGLPARAYRALSDSMINDSKARLETGIDARSMGITELPQIC